MAAPTPPSIFTATSLYSLLFVLVVLGVATGLASALLPKNASAKTKGIFVWLTFDALIHFIFEGSFLYYSLGGRTVNAGQGALAAMWREYAAADARWGVADETVVSLELLTVFGAGPLAAYIAYQLTKGDQAHHYWIVVLCTAELYGGWMTFCPEWLTGSKALTTNNWLYLWVYLFFMNVIWVVIPLYLLYDSYLAISSAMRNARDAPPLKREQTDSASPKKEPKTPSRRSTAVHAEETPNSTRMLRSRSKGL